MLTLSQVKPQSTGTDKRILRKYFLKKSIKHQTKFISQIQIGNEIQVTGEAESFEQAGDPTV